jgi:hypothetical protein
VTPLDLSIVLILNGLAHCAETDVQLAAERLQQRRQCEVQGVPRDEMRMTEGPKHVA